MGTSTDMGEIEAKSAADLETARLHFANGVALIQENPPNYQDAWQQFRLALDKSGGSWKVRGNLGYCALKLERDGEALEHYRVYLAQGGDDIDPKERADIERELLLLEGNMAWVNLSSSNPDAQIAVSRQGSSTPTQAYELSRGEAKLGLRAGDFTITASADGQTLTWTPLLTPGKKASYHFDFDATDDPEPKPAAELEPVPATPTETKSGPLQIAGYATLGAGVLTLGGGIIAGAMVKGKEEAATENCIGLVCPADDEDKRDKAENLARTANILLITGGVLAAAGVTLVLVGGRSSDESTALTSRPRLAVSPGVTQAGGALFFSGSY